MNFFTEGFIQAWALLAAFDPETVSAVRATMASTCYAMAIALETNKGEFAQGMALGLVLLTVAFVLNFALSFARRRDRAS